MYKLIPDILKSSTQTGSNDLLDPDEYKDITLIFGRAYKFFKSKLNEGRCDGIVDINLIIKDIQQAHKDGICLDFKSAAEYKLIPNSAKFNLDDKKVNLFSKENLKLKEIELFDEIIIECKTCEILQENIIIENRFLNFLSYFANLILIEKDIISNLKRGLPIYHKRIEQLLHEKNL
jgi:hypothetical protein